MIQILEGEALSTSQDPVSITQHVWECLQKTHVVDARRLRTDLMTWRRGSAQLSIKVSPGLDNLSIYSVLLSGVTPNEDLYRYLLGYNILQRRESLGMTEKDGKVFIVLKYTMELEVVNDQSLQRHILALQEVADKLDTEMAEKFGGSIQFEDWERLDQDRVDNLLGNLFD